MLKYVFTIALLSGVIAAQAQVDPSVEPMSRFKVRSFNVTLNSASDIYNDMSMQWMRDHTKNPADLEFDANGYEQTNFARVGAGGLGIQMSIVPLHKETMLYNNKHEFQIGLHTTLGREAMVDFSKEQRWADSESDEHVIFCLVDNEVSFNLGYVYSMYHGPLRVFAGPRIMAGTVMNASMLRMQHTFYTYYNADGSIDDTDYVSEDTEYYAAKDAKYARGFLQLGAGVRIFRNLEFVGTYMHGMGVEQISNGATNVMSHTYSIQGGFHWIFAPKKASPAPSI